MKKIMSLVLLGASLTQLSAVTWKGFYIRTGMSYLGQGTNGTGGSIDLKKTDTLCNFGLAGGWGTLFGSSFYLGADAVLGGFDLKWSSITGANSKTDTLPTSSNNFAIIYDPKITARIGYGCCSFLLYAGGGFGLSKALSDDSNLYSNFPKDSTDSTKSAWLKTWHIRVGVDLRLKGNWFTGVFYEYQRSFAYPNANSNIEVFQKSGITHSDVTRIEDRIAFVIGYQF
jgi:opacity protein-like surface antigen